MKTFLAIILLVFAIASGVLYYRDVLQRSERESKIEQEIRDLKNRKDQILKLDSIRSATEKRVYDSLSKILASRDARINQMELSIKKAHEEHEQLQKLYNSVRVAMPKF